MDAEIFAVVFVLGTLALFIALIVANWKVFTKAGRAGWKSLIPIYGPYVAFDIAGVKKLFPIVFIGGIVYSIVSAQFMPVYDYYGQMVQGDETIFGLTSTAYSIVMLVIQVKYVCALARSFGKGGGFAAGLFFLSPIFVMILGLGSAQYQGEGGVQPGWQCTCGTHNTPDAYYCKNCGSRMP